MKLSNRLAYFIQELTPIVESRPQDESYLMNRTSELLSNLVAHDDWLPAQFSEPGKDRYRQYLLHCDPLERFSVVGFVWAPGQTTPIHNHTVWGVIGMLRGRERCEEFAVFNGKLECTGTHELSPGETDFVSPTVGDIHRVSNARFDYPSVSVHVYGANIGTVHRSVFDPKGPPSPFVSGYSNSVLPNIWV